MPEERRISISSSHLAPDEVARHSFGLARKGYDPTEVRAYLESVAIGLRGIADREEQLLRELDEAEYRASHPVLDEPTLSAAVGSETARVLHSAHEAATEMVTKAEAEANRLLTEAREEIEQSRIQIETRLTELTAESEAVAAEVRERAVQQAGAHLEATRVEAEEMVIEAREECRAMVEEAQGLRTRVLADLSKRRKVLHAQIEQLRAGREHLAETVKNVRRSVDVIADELFAAEDNARLAAEEAGREALERSDESSPEELAALLLADEAAAAPPPVEFEIEDVAVEVVEETVEEPAIEESFAGEAEIEGPITEEVEITPAPEPANGGGADTNGAAESPNRVEALFARIRADRQEQGAGDEDRVAGPVSNSEGSAPGPSPAVSTEATPSVSGEGPGSAVATLAQPAHQDAEPAPGDQEEAGADEPEGPPDGRHPLAVRRDELIAPVVKSLSRRLKRTLQDDQNELLDRLRSTSRWSGELLPDTTEQTDAYATAALPILEEAAEAGAVFAGAKKTPKLSVDELVGIAHELAEAVVGPLRRRLADDEGLAEADEAVVAEHVGAAFREWKGERIERLAGDHVVAAFSVGTIAATKGKKSTALEWISDSGTGDPPCPDCEDNGLNGSLQPDEEFPTGHRHPPAHPGCRCLLVVAAT